MHACSEGRHGGFTHQDSHRPKCGELLGSEHPREKVFMAVWIGVIGGVHGVDQAVNACYGGVTQKTLFILSAASCSAVRIRGIMCARGYKLDGGVQCAWRCAWRQGCYEQVD